MTDHDAFREKLMEKINEIHTDVAVIKTRLESLSIEAERSRENHINHFKSLEEVREDIRTAQNLANGAAESIKSHKEGHWKWTTIMMGAPAALIGLISLLKKGSSQ
jgi:hypothetical protein